MANERRCSLVTHPHRTTEPTDDQLTSALKEYAAYLNPIIDRGEMPPADDSPWT
ncbi:hypothetical protein HTV45_03645 [Streptomyces sp. CHD11]|uniref:hypothetical protein n=1 Tax=Streptomyces sp. CHD11 TaxID=2741325 RepID=UPI001BFC29FC|nr:hypothetical protein [Streptomyces sp. CHD11]MBT3150007.1 hypothetical protein [Streptomyces sp. CHD11]